MNLQLITPPPFEPVTLREAKEKLRLIVGDESPDVHPHDSMIERHIKSARLQAERDTGRAFIQQTWRLFVDQFPAAHYLWSNGRWVSSYGSGYIELLKPPLISVDAVAYYSDTNELSADLDTAEYYVSDGTFAKFYLIDTFSYPALYRRDDAVRIDYTAGYAPDGSPPSTQEDYAANVPADIKDAILLGVELLYRSMDAKTREVTEAARMSLLSGYMVHPFA